MIKSCNTSYKIEFGTTLKFLFTHNALVNFIALKKNQYSNSLQNVNAQIILQKLYYKVINLQLLQHLYKNVYSNILQNVEYAFYKSKKMLKKSEIRIRNH